MENLIFEVMEQLCYVGMKVLNGLVFLVVIGVGMILFVALMEVKIEKQLACPS